MRKLILVLNILVMMVCAVWGQSNVWDGSLAGSLDPIESNPNVYHISTAAQLAKLANLVNDGDNFADKTVILQEDIVLNVGVLDKEGKLNEGSFIEWKPIGKNSQYSFEGTFDGNNKTVSGVYIVDYEERANLGLFGYLDGGGEIKNVGVEDSYVEGTGKFASVGGVCGEKNGGGTISNSYNAGSVIGTGDNAYVGGVCGYMDGGTISNSYNTGSVKGGKEASVGGVCGSDTDGTISNSYNAGSVEGGDNAYVGGVCGGSNGASSVTTDISNCYNAGFVRGGSDAKVGGVGGKSSDFNFTDCFYLDGTAEQGGGEDSSGEDEGDVESQTKELAPDLFVDAVNTGLVKNPNTPWVEEAKEGDGSEIIFPVFKHVPEWEYPEEEDDPSDPGDDEDPDDDEANNCIWLISSAKDLRWFAEKVNIGCAKLKGKLTEDITVSDLKLDEKGEPEGETQQWTPIGKDLDHSFDGTFDGQGFEVSGVYIVDNKESAYLGLFGCLNGGEIKNVGVVDSYVEGTGVGAYVGGVCGSSDKGTISNSYNAGSVTGTGEGAYVGGVCGINSNSLISNSYNTGSVEGGKSAYVGGVCGESHGVEIGFTISNSYNVGSVEGGESAKVGGVCGLSEREISNSYNAGLVTGGSEAKVGGVCGKNNANITYCFYLAGTAEQGVGESSSGTVTADPKKLVDDFLDAVTTWLNNINPDPDSPNSDPWKGTPSFGGGKLTLPSLNDVPVVVYSSVPGKDGEGYYEIYTDEQLRWFAMKVNGEVDKSDSEDGEDEEINGKLMQDITVSGLKLDADGKPEDGTQPEDHWTPIGKDLNHSFDGTFDGKGFKVSGVYIDNSNDGAYLGLFGYLGAGGEIQNVGVEDSYVKGTGERASVGGVCGGSGGSISNSYNTGSVEGGSDAKVGGVCGYGSGAVFTISDSYNAGSVEGGDEAWIGGVCGYSQGSISNSYNVGSVTVRDVESLETTSVGGVCGVCGSNSGSISNSYNAGLVTGENAYVGGVCGYNFNENNKITDCYYLAGTATSGIGKGVNSGNKPAAPKTAEELANVMAEKLNSDPWKGSASYQSGTLTLPTFSKNNPIVIPLEAVPADAWMSVIDFEGEKLKVSVDYQVIAGTSLEEAGPVENGYGEALLTDLIDNSATLYIYYLGKVSEVLEYKLERPDAPADITATTTENGSVQLTVQKVLEYSVDESNWVTSSTFNDCEVGGELTFYARYVASQEEYRFASKPAEIKVTLYSIAITTSGSGSVSANKTNVAIAGEKVTLTVRPSSGYELASLEVDGAEVSVSGNQHTFTMPAANVTVTATFKEVKPAPAPDPTPDPDPVYYTVTIPESITGAIIHGGGTHQVREGSYIDFSIEIDPAGTGEYPTVTVDGYWWNPPSHDGRGNYRLYVSNDCDIRIGEVSGYGTYTLTLPADSLFEGDDLYRSGVGIAVTPASPSPSSDALRYPFGTELTLTAVSDTHRTFVEWMDGSRRSPLTFRLREDTEAYAWFRALHPVGNEEIATASIRIRTERGGTIVVDTLKRLPIAIYALSGQCLRRSESEGTTRFSGLREGSYLVVVGTHSEVVIVR